PASGRSFPSARRSIFAPSRRRDVRRTETALWLLPRSTSFAIATLSFEISDSFEHGPNNQRQRHRRIFKYFREFPTFFRRNKFSPRHGFRVRAPTQPAPVHGLRTNPQAVVVALQRQVFIPAPRQQLRVNTELLRPISRNAA